MPRRLELTIFFVIVVSLRLGRADSTIFDIFQQLLILFNGTRWFKYDRDYLYVNKSQFVPVIFEPPCTLVNK
jgi:hypothetical protein